MADEPKDDTTPADQAADAVTEDQARDGLDDLLGDEAAPEAAPAAAAGDETATSDADASTTGDQEQDGEAAPEAEAAAADETETPAAAPAAADGEIAALRQELAEAVKVLGTLGKRGAAGELSPAQQRQAEAAQKAAGKIKDALAKRGAEGGYDVLEHGENLAEAVLETDQRVETAEQRLGRLEQKLVEQEQAATWVQHARDYPNANVKAIWANVEKDLLASIDPRELASNPSLRGFVQQQVDKEFHARCDAANKSVAAKRGQQQPPAGTKIAPTPTRPPVPVTKGGAAVTPAATATKAAPAKPQTFEEQLKSFAKSAGSVGDFVD